MRHFKQAARLYLFHKEPHCTDVCIQRLTLHPFILCSSQWAGGNGGEKGDKTKAHAKGESKIAPKVWTHTCSFGTWRGKLLARINKHYDSESSDEMECVCVCVGLVLVLLRFPQETLMPLLPLSLQHVGCQTLRPHREVLSMFPSLSN